MLPIASMDNIALISPGLVFSHSSPFLACSDFANNIRLYGGTYGRPVNGGSACRMTDLKLAMLRRLRRELELHSGTPASTPFQQTAV
jgi:hypothetical protein